MLDNIYALWKAFAVRPGLEPGLFWTKTRCVNQLHYRTILERKFKKNLFGNTLK